MKTKKTQSVDFLFDLVDQGFDVELSLQKRGNMTIKIDGPTNTKTARLVRRWFYEYLSRGRSGKEIRRDVEDMMRVVKQLKADAQSKSKGGDMEAKGALDCIGKISRKLNNILAMYQVDGDEENASDEN